MSTKTTRRPLPALVFLLVLGLVSAIVWWRVLNRSSNSDASPKPTPSVSSTCNPGAKKVTLPKAGAVPVQVLNGAGRTGLAAEVGAKLRAQGFTNVKVGNTASVVGIAELRFGAKGRAGALLLNFYLPGAKLVPLASRSTTTVDVALGTDYSSLATAGSVKTAIAASKAGC